MARVETPAHALADKLGDATLLVPKGLKLGEKTGRVAVNVTAQRIARKRLGLTSGGPPSQLTTGWKGLTLAVPGGEDEPDYTPSPDGTDVPPEELEDVVPEYPATPHIVVDLRFWDEHSSFGKANLVRQTVVTCSTVRHHLADEHVTLVNVTEDFTRRFDGAFPSFQGGLKTDWEELLAELETDEVILLDPNAEESLTTQDILKHDVFVLGGIVDSNMRGWTTRLGRKIPADVIPRRITLRGSIKGVPDRINLLTEALCLVWTEGASLEEAVLTVQTPRFARERLALELRAKERLDGETLKEIKRVVNLPTPEIVEEARRRGLKVEL